MLKISRWNSKYISFRSIHDANAGGMNSQWNLPFLQMTCTFTERNQLVLWSVLSEVSSNGTYALFVSLGLFGHFVEPGVKYTPDFILIFLEV